MAKPNSIEMGYLQPGHMRYAPKSVTIHKAVEERDPRLKEDVHGDSLAWYNARTGDVTVALHRIDPDNVMSVEQLQNVAIGLTSHVVAHAAWSDWMESKLLQKLDPTILSTLALFEEARVEYRAINAQLDRRPYFRAALRHGLGRHDSAMNSGDIAMAWGLMAGRRIARTIYEDEFEKIDFAARNAIGDDVVDELWDILQIATRASTGYDRGIRQLIALAIEWNELAGIPSSPMKSDVQESKAGSKGEKAEGEKGKGKGKGDPEDGEGDDGEGSGKGKGEGEDEGEGEGSGSGEGESGEGEGEGSGGSGGGEPDGESAEPMSDSEKGEDAIGEKTGDGEKDASKGKESTENNDGDHHGFGEGGAVGIPAEKRAEFEALMDEALKQVEKRYNDERIEMASAARTAHKVFGETPDYTGKKSSSSWTERDPSREVRLAATSLARQLEQVSTPVIQKSATNMALPPGRLRNREAVRGSAERARGMMSTAKPWKGAKRTHTQAPPAIIGVMTDVSGSMGWAEQTVAELAYIFAHAGSMVGARTAAVVFGDKTEMTTYPGEVPTKLRIHAADGGSEACDTAYAALDGVLHFTDGPPGNKILVVFSDGHFVSAPDRAANPHWQKKMCDAGVTIIWVNRTMPREIHDKRIQQVIAGSDPKQLVDLVMNAIRKGVDANAHR
jgi:uncharacterized protein with PIN domain